MQCHDCRKELKKGDIVMPYRFGEQELFKCDVCHKSDPTLRNFQPTEVYSRVVGYIRPVKQWNKGKQAEFSDRKEYLPTDEVCADGECAC